MAQHTHYWSCSPLADWIRGTNKLKAGTAEEWNEWTDQNGMERISKRKENPNQLKLFED